jgi:predicted RNase H-like HicB family nuclease
VKRKIFTVIVERDPESGWLVGEVAELPGCYTQAPDLPELEKNIQEAIRGYTPNRGRVKNPLRIVSIACGVTV